MLITTQKTTIVEIRGQWVDPYKAKILNKLRKQRVFFQTKNIINGLVNSFMGLRSLQIFLLSQCKDWLWTSESKINRRQILMSKVDPRAVRVILINFNFKIWLHMRLSKRSFSIWNHSECLSQLFSLHLNTYVTVLRSLLIFSFSQYKDRL